MTKVRGFAIAGAFALLCLTGIPAAQASPPNARLTNDAPGLGGDVSDYTLVTGQSYTDAMLSACSRSRGRQNEPAVAVDPRNPRVIVGSSNDYCGVFAENGAFIGLGSIWLGYYRSENAGASFVSSLVPGYPGDASPYAARAQVRTASSGDPVLAWDNEGRLFAGSESSGDVAGTAKTFGDVWVATYENPGGAGGATTADGKEFVRSIDVAQGSAAPNLLGVFHDKTAIEGDRTGGPCNGNVYFAWARFTGNSPNGYNSSVYFVRSTDHGQTFSAPLKLSQTFEPYDPTDLYDSGGLALSCGDFASECVSGYTFMRGGTQVRSTADQQEKSHDYLYVLYDPSIPGTEVPSGTTYGSVVSEDLPEKYHQNVGS